MIVRGTTPYHTFLIPLQAEEVKTVYVTYSQNGKVILDKTGDDLVIENVDIDDGTYDDNLDYDNETGDSDTSDNTTNMTEDDDQESHISLITIHLTQEDTLGFEIYPFANKNIAEIQVRVVDVNDEAYASDVVREKIVNVNKEGVIE